MQADRPFAARLRHDWLAQPRADILAGIVVSLALIPEAIGFALIAGVDPSVGLYASVVIAMVIALTGGRPGMISAATAAVAVVVARTWLRLAAQTRKNCRRRWRKPVTSSQKAKFYAEAGLFCEVCTE